MRMTILAALLLLAGCGAMTPMEELEHQAFLSGDWSAVEARERTQLRQSMRRGLQCPKGYMGYCEVVFASESCACVERVAVRAMLSGR